MVSRHERRCSNARARNAHVEATSNHPCAAQANGFSVDALARDVATTLTGVALWPRLVFDEAGTRVYDTRGPRGERMRSHWPTVLPPLAPAPGVKVGPGSTVVADFVTDLRDGKVSTPVRYSIACDVKDPLARAADGLAARAADPAAPRAANDGADARNADVADWAAAVDDASGRVYYYNTKTRATSWSWPPE